MILTFVFGQSCLRFTLDKLVEMYQGSRAKDYLPSLQKSDADTVIKRSSKQVARVYHESRMPGDNNYTPSCRLESKGDLLLV